MHSSDIMVLLHAMFVASRNLFHVVRSCDFPFIIFVHIFFFFFQAEDGIRDKLVTGVQTCALPIWVFGPSVGRLRPSARLMSRTGIAPSAVAVPCSSQASIGAAEGSEVVNLPMISRSEERRVGEEGRSRWSPDH